MHLLVKYSIFSPLNPFGYTIKLIFEFCVFWEFWASCSFCCRFWSDICCNNSWGSEREREDEYDEDDTVEKEKESDEDSDEDSERDEEESNRVGRDPSK